MTFARRFQASALRGAALAVLLATAAPGLAGTGFFDALPAKGYIRDDLALEVLSPGDRGSVVATIRYLRLALDPGRRDVAWDFWPERELLMMERSSGERLIVERVSKLPPPDAGSWSPRGRVSLEGGSVVETFLRAAGGTGAPPRLGACDGLDALLRAGNRDVPFAKDDLGVPTVRMGLQQVVESILSDRDRDLLSAAVPILLRAQSQGIGVGPLEILESLFPGRRFVQSSEALTFRVYGGAPLDPSGGSWRSMTQSGELLPGVPLY